MYASGGGSHNAQVEQIVLFKEIEEKRMKFSGRYEPTAGGRYASMLPPPRAIPTSAPTSAEPAG